MIRFYYEHCAHKISARDKDVGRQGKCPKCGGIIFVPTESTIIEFHCEKCGRRISAPRDHAGKKAVCPKCKSTFIIPAAQFTDSAETQNDSGGLIAHSIDSSHELTLIDVPEEYKLKDEPAVQSEVPEQAIDQQQGSKETESSEQRKLPWIIDIFLYPTSMPGLIHLMFFMGAQLVLYFLNFLLVFGLLILILRVLIVLYIYWYFTECIRDSAAGRIRAPEAFATSSLGDMWSQTQHIIGCYLIFAGPLGFYVLWTQRVDTLFWIFLAYGAFFFPMGLLACVMFDSIRGLNPVILLGSIFSTFFQYCGLVFLVVLIVLAVRFFTHIQGAEKMDQNWISKMLLRTLFYGVTLYAVFVVAHLFGRFYWRNHGKLNWEV
jgi:DNA-directed RNA polymerase subunit RPC12/RpoP